MNKPFSLGRIPIEDSRDKRYLLADTLIEETELKMRYWNPVWQGDQGENPYCVAFAWLQWMAAEPVIHRAAPIYRPRDVYNDAQQLDEIPGNNYAGTTVRAGAKAMKKRGVVTKYWWAWDLDVTIRAVLTLGPVVVGTNWYYKMFTPNNRNFIKIGGDRLGGHAYTLIGVDVEEEFFWLQNSWGYDWGENGIAKIGFEDLRRLIEDESGEVCLASERTLEKYK